jgi:molybdopterin molybdotransferase
VLSPAALGLAAALGQPTLRVHARPTVAVFTTGDELRPPGMPLGPGEIYDSNRALLQTLLLAEGYEPVAWPVLPDSPARIESALRDAADSFDVVFTCGGVSAGEKDYLPEFFAREGQVHFWKVRMRPGMPVLAATLEKAQFLALPGNPVSVLATFLSLGRRLLDGLQGRREARPRLHARLAAPIRKRHERLEFLRGELACDENGQWLATPNPADGSHRLRAAAESNALIVVPEGAGEWPAGSVLEVLPLPGHGR